MVFHHDKGQSVIEREFRDILFEGFQILRPRWVGHR